VHGAAPQQPGQHRHGPGKNRPQGRKPGQRPGGQNPLGGGIYTAPMDHSYRGLQNNNNGNQRRNNRGRMGQGPVRFVPQDPEPLPTMSDTAPTRIFAFVDDLFFLAKIQETARKLNVKVEFVKTDKELQEKMGQNGDDKPSLIIFDLNNTGAKPLTIIPKLKSKLKKATNIIGFVSHVQGELKMKAQEAGCDMVLPRSAFSQNLAQLLRRHGAPEEAQEQGQQPGQQPPR
jgi:CheY-like chemotaxis protein